MGQVRTEIEAGVCGFRTSVKTVSEDGMFVAFEIDTGCEKIRGFAEGLAAAGPVNAYEEISPAGESVILATARACLKGCCAGCVVPTGLFKSMQVAAGLALPADIAIHIEKG